MIVRWTGPDTSQTTSGSDYVVYWINGQSEVLYGICSNEYEMMDFPIYIRAADCSVIEPKLNPLWIWSASLAALKQEDLTRAFAFAVAHPLHIAEDKNADEKRGFFVERMTNGDHQAMALWKNIKSEMDSALTR